MSSQPPRTGVPVVGFNHNVGYKGRTFHVQTEDSWPAQAHIVSQLFLGGNVVASSKIAYANDAGQLDPAGRASAVRKMMESQHKAIMRALLSGTYDTDITKHTQATYAPGVLGAGARAPELLVGGAQKPAVAREATPRSIPPPSRPPAATTRPLDEVVLSYLLADLDRPRRP